MRSSDRGELRFRPCSCASFLLSAKGRGFSFLHFERNKRGCLAFKRISKIFFLLSAKGRGFSFLHFERNKAKVCLQADKGIMFSFGRQKKQKRQGAVFRVRPLQPENSSHPHKRKASKRGTTAPLSKGAKGKRQQEEKRDGNKCSSKDKAEMIN